MPFSNDMKMLKEDTMILEDDIEMLEDNTTTFNDNEACYQGEDDWFPTNEDSFDNDSDGWPDGETEHARGVDLGDVQCDNPIDNNPIVADNGDSSIRLVGYPSDWDIPPDVKQIVVLPPPWRGQAARPRRKRIPLIKEVPSKNLAPSPSRCLHDNDYRKHVPLVDKLVTHVTHV
ncbi:Uncharacterized protein TCM_017147 [Theobroma cacao]|uniref:Uncharacterized protein n=1 Tax=Theobroma cacao TaxID=3641 RepID=A0A061EED3_THECC|nr:Uncharacterized protein TCM_017147 [Theobroma cacao]